MTCRAAEPYRHVMADELATHYVDLLSGTYDYVYRIVLNVYFSFDHSPNGFQVWRRLHDDSDERLDNAHPIRMAGVSCGGSEGGRREWRPVFDCRAANSSTASPRSTWPRIE